MPQCLYNRTSTWKLLLLCKWVLTHSYRALWKNTNIYLIQIICTQLYCFKYSYSILLICTQLYCFKYSYSIQLICTQLYCFKYSYLILLICTQLYCYSILLICTQLYGFKQFLLLFIMILCLHTVIGFCIFLSHSNKFQTNLFDL